MAKAKRKSARATKRTGRKPVVTLNEAKVFDKFIGTRMGGDSQAMAGALKEPKRLTRAELELHLGGARGSNDHLVRTLDRVSGERNEFQARALKAEKLVALMQAFISGLMQSVR